MFCMCVPCCRPLLVILQWTFPLHRKLREQDVTIFHIQLCIALFCMLIVFVCGIDQTSVYGGCVFVSVLIHYFTLVAVMFMGAEAVLLFQKLIIVFGQTTAKFFIAVSLICWCECILVYHLHIILVLGIWFSLKCWCQDVESMKCADDWPQIHFPPPLPPVVPIIPVVIPMAVDLSDAVSRDLLVRRPPEENGRGL